MFDKITLITPSYRRQKYISRLVSFYSSIPLNLIIVDGTEGNPLYETTDVPASGSIRYFHQPGRPITERIAFANQLIQTPYVAWLGDDEFHVPSGLLKSIKILENDSMVSTAIGLCVGMSVKKGNIYWGDYYKYPPKVYKGSPALRVEDYFAHYSPTMAYSVWRTDNYLRALKISFERNWGSAGLGEFIHAFCGIIEGIHVVHDRLQWLRSTENPPEQAQLNRSISIPNWFNNELFQEERSDIFSSLQSYTSNSLKCRSDQAIDYVYLAFHAYLYRCSNKELLTRLGLTPFKNYHRQYKSSLLEFSCSQSLIKKFPIEELNNISR